VVSAINTEKNKKILVFFGFVTHFGGAQRSTVLLCQQLKRFYDVHVIDVYGSCEKYMRALAERNISVSVLLPNSKSIYIGYTDKPARRILRAVKQLPWFLVLCKRLREVVKRISPALVWVNGIKALTFLALSGAVKQVPVVMYARGWYKVSQLSWFRRWLIRHYPDCVLAVSGPTKNALQQWSVAESKIHVVYTTIDFEELLRESSKELVGPAPGIDKCYKILVPGLLARTKGQHTAIKAASLLKQNRRDFVMWLAGDESVGDKRGYKNSLEELIKSNQLEENVFLLGWRSDIRSLTRLADVVVLPTHTEGFPRAVQEAMVLRRPVISTPVGGIPELIIDGKTGLLMPVDDENALAQGLERLMSDKELSCRIAENAHKHMYENFHTDKQISLVRRALESEIGKRQVKK